jgi:hypothetical protein
MNLMQMSDTDTAVLLADGPVRHVDLINRELTLDHSDGRVEFDVPTDCNIMLRGEPVRLRIVQPRDCARVAYVIRHGRRAARTIDIRAGL